MRPKKELIRVVRTPLGEIDVDPTGKKSGRGAYICPETSCLELAVKSHRLDKALEQAVSDDVIAALREKLASKSNAGVNG